MRFLVWRQGNIEMKNRNETYGKVKNFIVERFPLAKQKIVGPNDFLIETGIVDSLGILDLVNFVEEEFKITVSDEDLVPEIFQSIQSITSFVNEKIN